MKIIKSFLLLTICLSTTTLLKAQTEEIKAQVLKQTEVKALPASTVTNKPSPAPQFKPLNGIAPQATTTATAETPSPLKIDDDKKQTSDANAATQKLTAEQLKTFNGKAEKPKQVAAVTVADAQNAKHR